MKDTLSVEQVVDRLLDDENASWSYQGAHALAEYLMDYERDTGQEMECDPVAFRCEFSEYESYEDAADDYGVEEDEDPERYFGDNTTVIEFGGGVIIQAF